MISFIVFNFYMIILFDQITSATTDNLFEEQKEPFLKSSSSKRLIGHDARLIEIFI